MRNVCVMVVLAAALAGCKKRPSKAACEKVFWHAFELGAREEPEFDQEAYDVLQGQVEARIRDGAPGDPELDEILDEAEVNYRGLMRACKDVEQKHVDCMLSKTRIEDFDACAFTF
jgi:hypothetical protein